MNLMTLLECSAWNKTNDIIKCLQSFVSKSSKFVTIHGASSHGTKGLILRKLIRISLLWIHSDCLMPQSTASRLPAARRTSLFIATRGQPASSSCQKPNGCRSPIVAGQTSRMWTSASPSPDKRAASSSILAKEWACHTWCWNCHNELDMSDKWAAATLKQTESVCGSEIDDDCKKCHYKISLSKQKTWGKMWQKNVTFWT